MSKKTIVQLFKDEETKEELLATTNHEEIIKIGHRKGFKFTREEFEEVRHAAKKYQNQNLKYRTITTSKNCLHKNELNPEQIKILSELGFNKNQGENYCYEFNLSDLQDFERLEKEFEAIKIKPNAVDINFFNKSFKLEDFNSASMSPNSTKFKDYYTKITKQNNNIDQDQLKYKYITHRDFHLINLDSYVEDKLYENYFQSKVRIVKTLKNLFEADIKLTGSFWYPPNAYRLWHTNEECVGWRMYLIDFERPELAANGKSFFRYMHPKTKELVTLIDKPKLVRFFKIDNQPEHLLWHCIVNGTKTNRWSYGFHVPDNWMEKIKLSVKS